MPPKKTPEQWASFGAALDHYYQQPGRRGTLPPYSYSVNVDGESVKLGYSLNNFAARGIPRSCPDYIQWKIDDYGALPSERNRQGKRPPTDQPARRADDVPAEHPSSGRLDHYYQNIDIALDQYFARPGNFDSIPTTRHVEMVGDAEVKLGAAISSWRYWGLPEGCPDFLREKLDHHQIYFPGDERADWTNSRAAANRPQARHHATRDPAHPNPAIPDHSDERDPGLNRPNRAEDYYRRIETALDQYYSRQENASTIPSTKHVERVGGISVNLGDAISRWGYDGLPDRSPDSLRTKLETYRVPFHGSTQPDRIMRYPEHRSHAGDRFRDHYRHIEIALDMYFSRPENTMKIPSTRHEERVEGSTVHLGQNIKTWRSTGLPQGCPESLREKFDLYGIHFPGSELAGSTNNRVAELAAERMYRGERPPDPLYGFNPNAAPAQSFDPPAPAYGFNPPAAAYGFNPPQPAPNSYFPIENPYSGAAASTSWQAGPASSYASSSAPSYPADSFQQGSAYSHQQAPAYSYQQGPAHPYQQGSAYSYQQGPAYPYQQAPGPAGPRPTR
jgi:hypothetical protein